MLIVQKYGGTSLSDVPRLQAAARRIAGLCRQGKQVVAVVSAQGQTTDLLLQKIRQLDPNVSARETDMCLATGEQLCAALLSAAISALDCPAVSLTGWQAGLQTDAAYGNARILQLDDSRIQKELAQKKAVVVAGFQGINAQGDITTLGRGGSDTTAVALAAFLHAELCQIFTDVDGVYDRDPRLYPHAVRFDRLSYGQMLRLIQDGAQVLHDRSVELAQEHSVPLEVLSAFTGAPGTIIEP